MVNTDAMLKSLSIAPIKTKAVLICFHIDIIIVIDHIIDDWCRILVSSPLDIFTKSYV